MFKAALRFPLDPHGSRHPRSTLLASLAVLAASAASGPAARAHVQPVGAGGGGAAAAAAAAGSVTTMSYHNGSVISPRIACLMWGSFSAAEITTNQNYLTGLAQLMSNHDMTGGVEPTLRQYGVWGAYFTGNCTVDSSVPSGTVDGAAIKAKIIQMQGLATNPLEPYSPETVVLVFTKGITMDANYGKLTTAGWCAYHSTAGTGNYWGIVPFPSVSACYTNFSLTAPQAFQKAASHELFEAATDPDLSAGWYAGSNAHEICDDCNSQSSIRTLPNGVSGVVNNMVDAYTQNCTVVSPAQTPPLSVVKTGTNTINVFAQDSAGGTRQISGDGVNWGSPQNRGGTITEAPTAFSADGTTIDVFGRGLNGGVWRWYFDGSNWSGPSPFGGFIIGPPSATYRTSLGTLVYARAGDGTIWYLHGSGSSLGWSRAASLPPGVLAISPPQAFSRSSDCSDIYTTGNNGHLYKLPNCSDTPVWVDMGGIVLNRVSEATRPSNASRVDVFANGPVIAGGATPFQKTINPPQGYTSLGGLIVGAASAVALGSSALRTYARGGNGLGGDRLYENISSNGTTWGGWGSGLDTVSISTAPLAYTPDNFAINLFLRRQDGELVHKRFDGANWQSIQDLNMKAR